MLLADQMAERAECSLACSLSRTQQWGACCCSQMAPPAALEGALPRHSVQAQAHQLPARVGVPRWEGSASPPPTLTELEVNLE